MVAKTIVIVSGSSFTLPADWSPLSNTIHAIGAGEPGPSADFNGTAGSGGRSGCYARIDNFNHPPGTVCPFHVGVPGDPDTWFLDTATLLAKGAQATTAGCVGSLIYPGSLGGASPDHGFSGGGGAGAPGPHGVEVPGVGTAGGIPDANFAGAAAQWTDSVSGLQYGPGAGGKGGGYQQSGSPGAPYGSGGGAAGVSGSIQRNPGGNGQPGLLVLVYTGSGVLAATEDADAAAFVAKRFDEWPLAAAETPDTAHFVVGVSAFGPLAVTEGSDSGALSGIVYTAIAMAAPESADNAAAAGTVINRGWLAAAEGPDVATWSCNVALDALLSASESLDLFACIAQVPAVATLAATEGPDLASGEMMLGAVWPRLTVLCAAVEGADTAFVAVAVGPIGNLEEQGVGGGLLYSASGPLERAIADVDVARMMAVPARLITENLDPWKVSSENLVFLAYGMGVTLWERSWSESTRREWVANQWRFKQAVGSLPAFRMALAASGYDIADYVTPPGGFFVSPDLTVDETNAWIRQMPQIRVKFAIKTGIEGVDEMFAEPDGAAGTTPGPDDSFWDSAAIGLDDGRALYGNIAVLRYADGHEVPLEMWDRVDTTKQVEEQVFEQISVPAFLPNAFFLDEDYIDDARYASADSGEGAIYSFIVPQVVNVTTPTLAMTPLVPGMTPLSPHYEINSDVEYDHIPSSFSDDWTPNVEYLSPDDGAMMLAHVMYLLDPAVTVPMTAGISFVDDARIGIPSDYAELAINTHTALPWGVFIADDNWLNDSSFAAPEDLTDFDRAARAVLASKALRDSVLISFERSLTADTPLPPLPVEEESIAAAPILLPPIVVSFDAEETGDAAASVVNVAQPTFLAAVEDVDAALMFGMLGYSIGLAAVEGPDAAAIAAGVGLPSGTLAAVEGPDAAAFAVTAVTQTFLAAVETPDVAVISGNVALINSLAAAEAPDIPAMAGTVASTASAAATEGADAAALSGFLSAFGQLAAIENVDAPAAAGTVAWVAYAAAQESPDALASNGNVRWSATLAAAEAPDVAALSGTVAWPTQTGRLMGVGVNAPFGYSANGTSWNTNYPSWAAAMPPALKAGIVSAGFNTVRLYVDPLPLFLAANDAAIDSLLAQPFVAVADLTSAGLTVIVDFHVQVSPSSIPGWGASDVIAINSTADPKFARMVHCAQRAALACLPYGNAVIFEPFNEPPWPSAFTGITWNAQMAYYYDQLRQVAPGLTLIVSGMKGGDLDALITYFDPSHYDSNTLISFHDYNPLAFVYQDASFSGWGQYLNRIAFPPGAEGQTLNGTINATTALINADTSLSSATKTSYINTDTSLLNSYFNTPQDAAWLRARYAAAASWADSHGVARSRMFAGEFGCIGDPSADNARNYISPTNGGLGADATSRANWYSTIAMALSDFGMGGSVHVLEADYFEITDGQQNLVKSITDALFGFGVPVNTVLPMVSQGVPVNTSLPVIT